MLAAGMADERTHTVVNTGKISEWSREQTFLLTEMYRSHPVLWDPRNDDYINKVKKKASAWRMVVAKDTE